MQKAYTPKRPLRKTKWPENYVIGCTNCPAWIESIAIEMADIVQTDNGPIFKCPACGSKMMHYPISVEKHRQIRKNIHSQFPWGAGWNKHPRAYIKRSNSSKMVLPRSEKKRV